MLNLDLPTSKHYGDFAVSLCVTYFLGLGYQVLLPFGDRGHYDLVVEMDGTFQRIQSKWTSSTKAPQGYPKVSLRVCGSSTTYVYCESDFDLLWVTTPEACYSIPSSEIFASKKRKSDLKLYPKWDKYRVPIPVPFPSGQAPVKRASPRLTQADKIMIRRLRNEGKSQQEVANIIGVTRACISKFELRNPS